MRAVGLAVLVCSLVLGGDAYAHAWNHHHAMAKECYQGLTAYKTGDYCYTSCAPTAACTIEVCISNGEWMEVPNCKARDCRKLC